MINKRILQLHKEESNIKLHIDASSPGFGAVLLQIDENGNFHSLQYISKETLPQQEKYSSFELE